MGVVVLLAFACAPSAVSHGPQAGAAVAASGAAAELLADPGEERLTLASFVPDRRWRQRASRATRSSRVVTRPRLEPRSSAKSGTCIASWYGEAFAGRSTAGGDTFDPAEMTAAHRWWPFGTRVEVSAGSRSVVVTITDRGPYVAGRCLDLSKGAFERLAPASKGVIHVGWRLLPD